MCVRPAGTLPCHAVCHAVLLASAGRLRHCSAVDGHGWGRHPPPPAAGPRRPQPCPSTAFARRRRPAPARRRTVQNEPLHTGIGNIEHVQRLFALKFEFRSDVRLRPGAHASSPSYPVSLSSSIDNSTDGYIINYLLLSFQTATLMRTPPIRPTMMHISTSDTIAGILHLAT